jgi:hypothetical protein
LMLLHYFLGKAVADSLSFRAAAFRANQSAAAVMVGMLRGRTGRHGSAGCCRCRSRSREVYHLGMQWFVM